MKNQMTTILSLLLSLSVQAQRISLDSVYVYAAFDPHKSVGAAIINLGDSILTASGDTFTELARRKLHLYLKEYGKGMISTLSTRGGYASQTGVYWNGIALNSALNGQTDLNSFSPVLFQSLTYRQGGGSVMLGSGAVSGAINLENKLSYESGYEMSLLASRESFDTYKAAISAAYGGAKLATRAAVHIFLSENDYPYPDREIINENGQIQNYAASFSTGYHIGKNEFYIKSLWIKSGRNISRTLLAPSFANLEQQNTGVTTGWRFKWGKWKTELQSAYLSEIYDYTYDTRYPGISSENRSKRLTGKAEIIYIPVSRIRIISGMQYENTLGTGDNISSHRLQNAAWHVGVFHRINPEFQYHFHLRKEIHSLYDIPLIMALDAKWKPFLNHTIRFNYSSNYRSPTLNDLYWIGGGNQDLQPEHTRTYEVGYEFESVEKIHLDFSIYHTKSKDLIQWQPGSSGFWTPLNIQKINITGMEIEAGFPYRISPVSGKITGYYHYTLSRDVSTGNSLMYNPKHTGGGEWENTYHKWKIFFSYRYTGQVYTTTTQTNNLPGYGLYGVELLKVLHKPKITLSGKINNLFDTSYQVMPGYPMPGRSYALQIKYQY